MKNNPFITLLFLFILAGCSGQSKEQKNEKMDSLKSTAKAEVAKDKAEEVAETSNSALVLSHVDNRAVVYANDSIIFDTGMVVGGPYDKVISLAEILASGRTDIKVELYNGIDEGIKPGWMIVYDIYWNGELVDFIREKKNETKEGLVFTETHDLSIFL